MLEVVPTEIIFENVSVYVVESTFLNEKFELGISEFPHLPDDVFWVAVHNFAALVALVSAFSTSSTRSLKPSPRFLNRILP